jgi:hypothetical protein
MGRQTGTVTPASSPQGHSPPESREAEREKFYRVYVLYFVLCLTRYRNLEGEDNTDLEITGVLDPFRYGERLKLEEDQEHEFKSTRMSIVPVQRITDYCAVRTTFH